MKMKFRVGDLVKVRDDLPEDAPAYQDQDYFDSFYNTEDLLIQVIKQVKGGRLLILDEKDEWGLIPTEMEVTVTLIITPRFEEKELELI